MKKFLLIAAVVTAVVIILINVFYKKTPPPVVNPPVEYTPPVFKEIIPQPSSVRTLADSTHVYFIDSSSKLTPVKDFPKKREVGVDGHMYFETQEGAKPLVVRSRLLVLTVVGKAAFRVICYSKEEGEEVQVLSGEIRVKKNYKSQFSEPDTLRANQMVMINISIDLMEKEKLDTRDFRAWRDTIRIRP